MYLRLCVVCSLSVAPIRGKIACELYPLGESVYQRVSYSMHNSCQGFRVSVRGGANQNEAV